MLPALHECAKQLLLRPQMEFEYGPPWSAKPFDELLGELLLADGQQARGGGSVPASARHVPKPSACR